jgi:adenine deaminase
VDALARRLAVARGDEPADLVVRGGQVLSVFTKEWLHTDVAIVDGVVAGLGEYEGKEVLDAHERYVVPGFVDAHMHIETVKLLVDELARLLLPLGTTTIVADPHEIANVLGTDGVHWLLDACDDVPLDVYFTASSCVPASRFESPRRPLSPGDLEGLLRRRRMVGLAEMMNYPGVIGGDPAELAKLRIDGLDHIDGHAPGVLGRDLQAYAAAGIGSDHEASSLDEGRERLRAGMWLLIREASAARNLAALLPLVAEYGTDRIAFCTDDREPEHIADDGHINAMVRDAVAQGVRPEDAIVLGSLNPARWHRLDHLGAIAPGFRADLLVLPDLERFVPDVVLKRGRPPEKIERAPVPDWMRHTVRLSPVTKETFRIEWLDEAGQARVIGVRPGQIVTDSLADMPSMRNGEVVADPATDTAKLAVLERHLGTGRVGLGLVRGLGLQRGALASSVAHDAHNLIVAGVDDESMVTAARRVAELGGGLVATLGSEVLAELPLPVAGILSDRTAEEVIELGHALGTAAFSLGSELDAPFQTLAFLALSVIPSLKLTDQGLVDVDQFELVPLGIEGGGA